MLLYLLCESSFFFQDPLLDIQLDTFVAWTTNYAR